MLTIGHISIGYLTAKLVSKKIDVSLNIPAIWGLSLLPDIDFLIPGLKHMGPSHSIILVLIIFIPLFLMRGKEVVPYFVGLASHTLLGDCITNRSLMLLWPISSRWVSFHLRLRALKTLYEISLFVIFLIVFYLSRDHTRVHAYRFSNFLLMMPLTATVLPLIFHYPFKIPRNLTFPHMLMLIMIIHFLWTSMDKANMQSALIQDLH